MSNETPKPDLAKLAKIKKAVDIHIGWLKERTGEWESHSMGVPVKDMILLLSIYDRLLALAEENKQLREDVKFYNHKAETAYNHGYNICFGDVKKKVTDFLHKETP